MSDKERIEILNNILYDCIMETEFITRGREISIVKTKLQEAKLWLSMVGGEEKNV